MSPSKAVYRRRRIVFVLGLLLVAGLIAGGIWLLIAQPWAAAPAASPTSTSSPAPTGTPSPGATTAPADDEDDADDADAPGPCRPIDIVVEAITDADTYPEGALPQLSISLTNTGSTACTLDVGSATQVFVVTSGDDVWWRSTDCQENPSSMVVTLEAGQNVTSAEPVTWDRTRSDISTCDQENRPRAPGGGASYHVDVSIGGFDALNSSQILLY
ncbi:hypothetical protein HD600_000769 [Microbacterium ginsengiterrae]|uniref:DUF4232 domain-containing protein n=1 Tax=Microbacterium ginsengiterrae TaxID=546115 RepID=A0A7W9FAL6_9MICO|nr:MULTISPECIES: hypothetical protein [Microbacterium]MBB5742272.1 hypothetical protein [Microbacterium ginsengiterrae]